MPAAAGLGDLGTAVCLPHSPSTLMAETDVVGAGAECTAVCILALLHRARSNIPVAKVGAVWFGAGRAGLGIRDVLERGPRWGSRRCRCR